MTEQIQAKLEELRGMLQSDGGDMDVVAIEGKTVKLRLRGACGSCPTPQCAQAGIERCLRESIDPESWSNACCNKLNYCSLLPGTL